MPNEENGWEESTVKSWNVLVTSLLGQERNVYRELRQTGDFRRTDFRDVFIGWAEDMETFLSAVFLNTVLMERIGFEDPDYIIVIETVAAWCGVGIINRI